MNPGIGRSTGGRPGEFLRITFLNARPPGMMVSMHLGRQDPSISRGKTMKTPFLVGLVPLILCVAASLQAEVRTWTDSTGKHKTRAELISVKDGKVALRKENGKTVTLKLERLSDADQKYLADLDAVSYTHLRAHET